MRTEYKRVPLTVDALFMTDGSFKPLKIYFDGAVFEITKVLSKRRCCPREVGCIAPIEYTVLIERQVKRIYYESDTNMWFSVKEMYFQ